MTITQLEYIVAIADCKSFAKAAKKCHVTQSTLSIQVKKLEGRLNAVLFDRSKKPVQATNLGLQIIEQARISLGELNRISQITEAEKEDCGGEIRLGIIPTVSPYLIPLFSFPFLDKHPNTELIVREMLTEEIVYALYNNDLDLGILVTPLNNPDLKHIPLYYEPFIAYLSQNHELGEKASIEYADLNLSELWLLQKGHCFRNQVFNICGDKLNEQNKKALRFESGNLEVLRRLVDKQCGYTLLPSMATLDFSEQQLQQVRPFTDPKPVREVSLIMNRRFIKRNMVESLKQSILDSIPEVYKNQDAQNTIKWD